MGLRSLRRAVGGLIQKANKSDPIFREALRNDVVGRQFVKDHIGPIDGAQMSGQPAAQQVARPNGMPMRNDAGWQMQRIAALRERFGRPSARAPMAPAVSGASDVSAVPAVGSAMVPQAPAIKKTLPYTTRPVTSAHPGTMAESPIITKPANPAASDMAAYSNAWQTLA